MSVPELKNRQLFSGEKSCRFLELPVADDSDFYYSTISTYYSTTGIHYSTTIFIIQL